jgi:hypothetical protein
MLASVGHIYKLPLEFILKSFGNRREVTSGG